MQDTLLVTSRASYEVVHKAAEVGCRMVAAISADAHGTETSPILSLIMRHPLVPAACLVLHPECARPRPWPTALCGRIRTPRRGYR